MERIRPTVLFFLISTFSFVNGNAQPPWPPLPTSVTITEVMFNSPEIEDSLNFIELKFAGTYVPPLDSFILSSNIDFQFPDSMIGQGVFPINPILIAQDSVAFESVYGVHAFQWGPSTVLAPGQPISIEWPNHTGDTMEIDTFSITTQQANGSGHSLTRCSAGSYTYQSSLVNSGIVINGIAIYADPGDHISESCIVVGDSEINPSSNLSVYPNPNKGVFTLDFSPLHRNAILRIRDNLGQIVLERMVKKGSSTLAQTIKFNQGIYLLELDDGYTRQHEYLVVSN